MWESDTKQPEPGWNAKVIISSASREWTIISVVMWTGLLELPTACTRVPLLLQRRCLGGRRHAVTYPDCSLSRDSGVWTCLGFFYCVAAAPLLHRDRPWIKQGFPTTRRPGSRDRQIVGAIYYSCCNRKASTPPFKLMRECHRATARPIAVALWNWVGKLWTAHTSSLSA